MRALAVQGAINANNENYPSNLNAEMAALTFEIDRIAPATTWAGQSFLASTGSDFWFQIGKATGCKDQLLVTISSLANTTLEVNGVVNADAVSLSDFGKAVNGTTSPKSQVVCSHAGTCVDSAGQATFKFNTQVSGAANGCNHTIASDTFCSAQLWSPQRL